jgi:hypothetical protein
MVVFDYSITTLKSRFIKCRVSHFFRASQALFSGKFSFERKQFLFKLKFYFVIEPKFQISWPFQIIWGKKLGWCELLHEFPWKGWSHMWYQSHAHIRMQRDVVLSKVSSDLSKVSSETTVSPLLLGNKRKGATVFQWLVLTDILSQ